MSNRLQGQLEKIPPEVQYKVSKSCIERHPLLLTEATYTPCSMTSDAFESRRLSNGRVGVNVTNPICLHNVQRELYVQ